MMSNLGFGFDNDYYQNMKYFDEDEIETVLVFFRRHGRLACLGSLLPKQ